MINGCEVRVAFSGDTKRALDLAADELEQLGYGRKKLADDKLEMFFKGKWITSDPSKMRHFVWVRAEGGQLVFAFGTGIVASHWTENDREWAQARADAIVSAIRAQLASG